MKSILFLLLSTGVAAAQVSDVEVPAIVLDQSEPGTPATDDALDLANAVLSAAKGVTTVQEAPAIVTVVTADDIRDRQFSDLEQLADSIPGWYRVGIFHSTFPTPLVRGQPQAVQFLTDGLSLFDPFVNIPAITRVQPMEEVKRVEMITGPGGVLWGSNSLLGIFNVITKDADDVDGVEMGATLGDGDGDRRMARAYAMVGAPHLPGGLKLFAHGSVETYQGPALEMPLLLFHDPIPQPNSANTYGPLTTVEEQQSMLVNLDAKLTLGKLQLRVSAPFGKRVNPLGLSGQPVRSDLPEDARCMQGSTADPTCFDPLHTSRENRADVFDRYAVAEYHTRFAHETAGITARAYAIEFVREFDPLQVLAPSATTPGGLAFQADLTSYRTGGAIDGDVELGDHVRVQYGGEAFREWKPDDSPDGNTSEIVAPYDLTRLPLQCPRTLDPSTGQLVPIPGCPLTFAFPADRTVFGAYLNPQWRPNKKLIFDVGARIQVAPSSLGSLSYPVTPTLSGTFVYEFVPSWHVKLNFAQGFRPPVFNNTTSNGEGLQIGGNPNLQVETSNAAQAEINARIFKGERRIRELSFRLDASYTRLDNLIQVASGQYFNAAPRDLASIEFLGKLYLQGGHRIELGYTYLRGQTSDTGLEKGLPENWFDLSGVWSLIPNKLGITANLRISGAAEDPNRLVEYRGSSYDAMGNVVNPVTVAATDLVLDRIPPMADLSLGITYSPTSKLTFKASVYNALNGHYYQPDVFFDYEPHLEYLPNPYEGFRAYVSALVQY